MSQFMTHLIYSSFSGAVLIAFVMLLRPVLTKKAPRWIACVLWGMVGVRLLVPFSLESEWSILPEMELSQDETVDAGESSHGSFGESITSSADRPSDAESSEPSQTESREESAPPVIGQESETLSAESAESSVAEPNTKQEQAAFLGKTAWVVWLCGASVLMLYALINYLLLRRRVSVFSVDEQGIRRCEQIDMPFVLGAFRPHIYLPFGLSREAETYIIAHERAHISRFDHATKLIAFVALVIHWFNPLAWLAFVLFCRDIEYACDEKVVRKLSNEERKAYANALLISSIRK